MRRFIFSFIFIGFLHLAYGLFVSFWRPVIYQRIINSARNSRLYDYAGALGVKTSKSTGSGGQEEISAAAQSAGLDFVILTDFNNFSIDLPTQPYLNNVLFIVGGEYSYLDSRILNFDLHSTDHLQGPGRSQVAFADLLSRENPNRPEGLFVLAHPLKKGYQMRDAYPEGLDGIELLNLKQVWQQTWLKSKISFLWTAFIYPFNSNLAFIRMLATSDSKETSLWDSLNQRHPVQGYYSNSAEAKMRLPGDMYLKFPSYETLFSIAQNHILLRSELTGNPLQDRKKISDALRRGQFYMSLDILQNPKGFESYLSDENGDIHMLGARLPFKPGHELVINLPDRPNLPFETVIFKNGEKIASSTSVTTNLTLHSPGVYRAAVRVRVSLPFPDGKKWLNWIMTNPIYLN